MARRSGPHPNTAALNAAAAQGDMPAAAIAAAIEKQLKFAGEDPPQLEPGEYPLRGRVTIELDCSVSKGDPVGTTQSFKPDWPAVVACILDECKIHPDRIQPFLTAVFRRVGKEKVPVVEKATVDAVIDTEKAKMPAGADRQGATKVSGRVELVSYQPTSIAAAG
jgi:hypothetical protein